MERFFNTAGSNKTELASTADPLHRFDLDEVGAQVEDSLASVLPQIGVLI
jgi:hypothetical protein